MPIPSNIRLAAGQIVMAAFGPDPRKVQPPGLMRGPLGVQPEMYKERHAIVLAATNGLTTIAPFSTVAPRTPQPFHFRIPAGKYSGMSATDDSWVKGDLLTTISNERIDRPLVVGRRTTVRLDTQDLKDVRAAILNALQLGRLTPHL